MMEMSLRMGMYQQIEQRLSFEQKHELKLLLELKLVDPELPNPTRGMEGLLVANQILKQRNSTGVLIGGLAREVWNQKRKLEDLAMHKDVDVMVINENFELVERFEGGIDWWLPYTRKINIEYNSGALNENVTSTYWVNGNGALLYFGANQISALSPGLYIPSPEWVTQMREYEVTSTIDPCVQIDWDIIEKFKGKIQNQMGKRLPKYIRDEFKDQIMSDTYAEDWNLTSAIRLVCFDLPTVTAMQNIE